jgi:hypothetical protein
MPAKASTREVVVLAVLLVVLAAVVIYELRTGGAPRAAGAAVHARTDSSRVATARDREAAVPEVRLSALRSLASMPVPALGRNPFVERPVPPPAPPPPGRGAAGAVLLPAGPPPPPPITLRLVAIVQGSGRPIAALSDGREVFYGREGDVVEGRYKIIKINVESIDISYLDGRGQRRLGLTG